MAAPDVWAALELAEREAAAKPAAKGKGAQQTQPAQGVASDVPFVMYDVGLMGEVDIEPRPASYKPPLPPLSDLVRARSPSPRSRVLISVPRAPTRSCPPARIPSSSSARTTSKYSRRS